VLAVVICAIALSLAYPVREYIAQRQQIDQLLAAAGRRRSPGAGARGAALQADDQTWYVEQQAEDELHMCFPQEQCYEVVSGQSPGWPAKPHGRDPWYAGCGSRSSGRRPARQVSSRTRHSGRGATDEAVVAEQLGRPPRGLLSGRAPVPVRAPRRRRDRAPAA
jgi:hypothetical protein